MTKHRSPDERSEQILLAARRCFLRRGYASTTMDDVSKESGLSKGGIYFHFSSKREIFRALVQQEFDQATSFMDQTASGSSDLLERLVVMAEHFVSRFLEDPDQSRLMLVAGQMALHDEPTRELLLELQEHYIQRLQTLLDEAIAAGALRPVDTRSCALLLKAMLDGVQASIAVGYVPEVEPLVAAAVDLLARGLEGE